MLHAALGAAELLRERGLHVAVVAMPWLNRLDADWLATTLQPFRDVFVVEDHAPVGGLGDAVLRELAASGRNAAPRITVLGVEGWPACGTPPEALRFHGLDADSLAQRIGARLTA
jgi:transketolase